MDYQLFEATEEAIENLIKLYFEVYGNSYPLKLGTDRSVMKNIITSKDDIWIVAKNSSAYLSENGMPWHVYCEMGGT